MSDHGPPSQSTTQPGRTDPWVYFMILLTWSLGHPEKIA